ncbi:MAG: GreA/GreB family elongation factor, partial [archaeon]
GVGVILKMVEHNKLVLLNETINALQMSLEDLLAFAKRTKEDAIASPGAAVSHSDTSKNQLQILTYGLDKRIYRMRAELSSLRGYRTSERFVVSLGALVYLEEQSNGERRYYCVFPAGAGESFVTHEGKVNIITPNSPLFIAMRGKQEGDEFSFRLNNRESEYCILSIQ